MLLENYLEILRVGEGQTKLFQRLNNLRLHQCGGNSLESLRNGCSRTPKKGIFDLCSQISPGRGGHDLEAGFVTNVTNVTIISIYIMWSVQRPLLLYLLVTLVTGRLTP